MITVRLYGNLQEHGRRFDLHVASPAEALHALFTQLPGLKEKVEKGFFQVRFKGRDFSEAEVEQGFGKADSGVLHIVPNVAGAGGGKSGGVWQVVAGVVLIVVGYFVFSTTSAWGMALISAGTGFAMGGVAQMLTKPPKLDMEQKGVRASCNTAFSNLDNTAAQGQPVPLAYGLVYCGSRVISQGMETRRLKTEGNPVLADPQAADVTLRTVKTFTQGKKARAPNGGMYDTDFNNDSVKARNYEVTIEKN